MLESTIFGQVMNYYLWLFALTLAFSSSIIFFKLYAKSRGTPLGRSAFFISLNSFLWSLAIAILSVPSITMVGVYTNIFLVAALLAGVASIFAAYYRAMIQWLLTPNIDGKFRAVRVYYVLCILAFSIALFSGLRFALNIPYLNEAMKGQSILGEIGIMVLTASLITLSISKTLHKFAYLGIALALIIGFIALTGNWLLIRVLLNPFHSGFTPDLTAVGLIATSLGAILSIRKGLKTWVAQFIPVTCVLLIAILALIGYIINLPTLYNEGAYVGISLPTVICFLLIGSAQVWYAWNRR